MWKQAKTLLPARVPRSTDITPSQPHISETSRSTFLVCYFLGVPRIERGNSNIQSHVLRGGNYLHTVYNLFLSATEALVPEPLHIRFELLPHQP